MNNMAVFNKKADFMMVFSVANANVNGDPNADARPRVDDNNYGLMSDVCFKHKVRNYLTNYFGDACDGNLVLMRTTEECGGFNTVKKRLDACYEGDKNPLTKMLTGKAAGYKDKIKAVCEKFVDVRMFGATIACKDFNIGIRGPITVQWAKTVVPVVVLDNGITKCISLETEDKKGKDTMGTKSFVKHGLYVVKGTVNGFNAENCGLTEEDVEMFKQALMHLFDGDESAARPSGSIRVEKVFWWQHDSKLGAVSSADIFDTVHIECNTTDPLTMNDYTITFDDVAGYPAVTVLK